MQKSLCNKLLLTFVCCLFSVMVVFGQQKFTPSTYIKAYSSVAQQLMQETGIPASVILAVAIHESAYGNSRIARHLNNHFGIKGKNSSKVIRSAYKGYASVLASYQDFADLLKRRKSTQHLFNETSTDYTIWVNSIARSGYSVTKDWRYKVLATIDRYNLDEYDKEENQYSGL